MAADGSVAREGDEMLGAVLGLLRADAPGQITGAPQDWPRWAVLLPHVLAATSHFDIDPQDAGGADAAWLLDRAAGYLQVHARLAEARPLAERALAIDEAAYGPDHPNVAIGLNNLATILRGLGQLAEARPLAERALAIDEAAYGPDHPDVAIRPEQPRHDPARPGATGRGPAAGRAGPGHHRGRLRPRPPQHGHPAEQPRHDPARPGATGRGPAAGRAGPGHHEAAYGPDHPDVAIRLNNLAAILRDLGQPAEARPLAERALAIAEAAYGPDHPDVAIRPEQPRHDPAGPGSNWRRPGRWPSGPWPSPRPPTAPTTPPSPSGLNNLALILRDLGQPAEARPLAERALAIDEAAYGPDHPDVAIDLNNLAMILQDLGQPAEARPLAERALAIAEAAYGPDHPTAVVLQANLSLFAVNQDQSVEENPAD